LEIYKIGMVEIITALRRPRQEDGEVKPSLGYITKPYLKVK
jgi:hypothetical protein